MNWQLKPAQDFGLSARERLRSQAREAGLGSVLLQGAWRRAVRGYLALFHRLTVVGRENLPARPPFVLIANHTSHLDALTLSAVLRGEAARRAFSLAAGDVFFSSVGVSAFAAYAVNALPLWRKRNRQKDLLSLRRRLTEEGLVFILFPEGTRSRNGRMAPFQPGIGALVAGSAVPVVPCHLDGAFAAWPPDRRLPRPLPLHLTIGAPLRFDALANDRAGWDAAARACEDAVRGLAAAKEGR